MSCPPEHALHQGKCVPQCPPQSYKNDHGRCQGETFSFTLLIFCSTRPCRFTGKHKIINLFSSELKNHSFWNPFSLPEMILWKVSLSFGVSPLKCLTYVFSAKPHGLENCHVWMLVWCMILSLKWFINTIKPNPVVYSPFAFNFLASTFLPNQLIRKTIHYVSYCWLHLRGHSEVAKRP